MASPAGNTWRARRRHAQAVLLGTVAIAMGLPAAFLVLIVPIAMLRLICGIKIEPAADLPGDLYEGVILFILGAFCAVVSLRWIVAAARLWSRDEERREEAEKRP